MAGESCGFLRGVPADSVRELLSPEGFGKMLLSERRVGPVESLRIFYGVMKEEETERPVVWCDELPEEIAPGTVFFVPEHRNKKDFGPWLERLPEDAVVICAQELCHQVSAVYRFR